ncbi:MAG TPA: C1 family peptidase [Bacteroidales bacterium]|nr:C1 family peptidase [Bacteroidales bacterium]
MKKQILIALILFTIALPSFSQKKGKNPALPAEEGYKFTTTIDLRATPVKNQAATGTCWSFATTSFIESELIRLGKDEFDLSEMYIVRHNYIDRLKDNYLRMGKGNIEEGSNAHDWMRVFSESGIVPDEVYTGLNYGSATHNHRELQLFLKAIASVPLQLKYESKQYREILNSTLDIYFGKIPESFVYKGVTFTPASFSASLGINPDDYIELTSCTHFPFYTRGVLEIPDNWAMAGFYNVPLDELMETMNYSLQNGYTVNWDGDTSEEGFLFSSGIAVNPLILFNERASRQGRPRTERLQQPQPWSLNPAPEVNVTQDIRQAGYETFITTDDHGMHITGIAKDQNGTVYYKTKNSWGPDRNPFGGYLNMSESYVRAKTLFIMVHKNGIPPAIRAKLGL